MLVSPVKLFIKAFQCANELTLRHIELMRSTPPLYSACFVFMGLVSVAVDTELHCRLGSQARRELTAEALRDAE